MSAQRKVGILLFNDVELLDFAGPCEVFSVTGRSHNTTPFDVYTVAEASGPVLTRNLVSINPRYTFADAPLPQVLVVPGGWGTRRQLDNSLVIDWICSTAAHCELVLSVCTGSLLLAKAGLLDRLKTTTHHGAYDLLEQLAPSAQVLRGERIVDNGKFVCSAGISAGIDAAFHVVARLLGEPVAAETATYMEYLRQPRG
jgi:transcriptional regulator GlxA family with amidase domain